MERIREEISRVLAMEETNSAAIRELRDAITSLRDVIGELGTNAALQGQALLGIKEVFNKEVTQLRDDQNDIARSQQKMSDDASHKDELQDQKFTLRFDSIERRVGAVENKASRAGGYSEGSKYILGFTILAAGGLIMWALEHIHFGP